MMWMGAGESKNGTFGLSAVATSGYPDGPFSLRRTLYPDGNETHDQTVFVGKPLSVSPGSSFMLAAVGGESIFSEAPAKCHDRVTSVKIASTVFLGLLLPLKSSTAYLTQNKPNFFFMEATVTPDGIEDAQPDGV